VFFLCIFVSTCFLDFPISVTFGLNLFTGFVVQFVGSFYVSCFFMT
jgi:hypothetical protein